MQALKRELSLDLNTVGGAASKLSTDCSSTLQQQRNQNLISPNSNFTDNTSQSVTPSEFGYQNLQRQLSMHSLIATEENSPAYEEYENTPSNLSSPLKHLASPIKSTISITYNLNSPQRELFEDHKARESHINKPSFLRTKDNNERKVSNRPLLETSFDENTVYEQVKFFRNSVTEVNQLLNEDRKYLTTELENLAEIEELSESERESDKEQITPIDHHHHQVEDIQMSDEEKLLYENVELRKPKSVYENLMGESMKQNKNDNLNNYHQDPEVELDSLDSIKEHESIETIQITSTARRSPSNFSVKELANKFESSPVEQMPAFDFSTRHSVRKSTHPQSLIQLQPQQPQPNLNTHPERGLKHQQQQTSTASLKQKLNKSQQITRSLDENAFIREFGNKNLQELKIKSSQQLPELTEHCSRRKSFDFTRPKTLNPPKRLPGMPITEEHFNTKTTEKSLLRIDMPKEKNFNNLNVPISTTPTTLTSSSLEHDYESTELKITPTTENRISLIQNNVQPSQDNSQDVNNSNVSKVLSGVKLDRERIDRIKEERRQQLTQKYHTDSFKSKSKSDLNTSSKNDDEKFISDNTSLRVKSKSRADMRTLQKDMDNLKEFGRNPPSTALSETTLNTQHQQHRVRSISDEKNQNNYVVETNANSTETNKDNNFIKRSPHSQHNLNRTMMTNNSSSSPDQEEFSARATVQKFERKSMDFANGVSVVGSVGMINAPINSLSRERSRQQDLSISSTTTTSNLTPTTTSRNNLSSK